MYLWNKGVDFIFVITAPYIAGGLGGPEHPRNLGVQKRGEAYLISAYRSLAITTNTPGFKKLSTALNRAGGIRGQERAITPLPDFGRFRSKTCTI